MPRRTVPIDPSIGERIKARRQLKRWSVRFAAQRAGISHSTWSRIERGELRTDRYMVTDLAAALECTVVELTGKPRVPGDRALESAHARVEAVFRALMETAPDEPADRVPVPLPTLVDRLELVTAKRRDCDFAAVGDLLPDLLLDIHAAEAGPESRAASLMMVKATHSATFTLRELGYVAEAALAGERCRQAAERTGDAVPLAVADWVRAHAAVAGGSYRRAVTLATRAIDALGGHLAEPAALDLLGMHHLLAALSAMPTNREEALAHVEEAWTVAQRTGDGDAWTMAFGPSNVAVWKMDLHTYLGEPRRAVEAGQAVNPTALPSASRQMAYYLAMARALTDLRRDQDAIRMLLVAERTAPQLARSSTDVRETGRYLLNRSQRLAGGSELRGLCERMGVAA